MKKHERRFLIPDYSHPSYYFRLLHEGRPKPKVFEFHIDDQMPVFSFLKDDLFRGTPAGEPASSVDPLADVW